jgi:hypothetical protein
MKTYYLILFIPLIIPSLTFGFEFDSNVSRSIRSQLTQDLALVETIESERASDLHIKIFGSVSGTTYISYFNSRVEKIGKDRCKDKNAVACVIPKVDSTKIWLTENYVKLNQPQMGRIMTLFHEARHTENEYANWPHSTCPDPFLNSQGNPIKSIFTGALLAGERACDETPYGSYGTAVVMLKNIYKFCTNCTAKVKMDAGIYADDQLNRISEDHANQALRDDLYH